MDIEQKREIENLDKRRAGKGLRNSQDRKKIEKYRETERG